MDLLDELGRGQRAPEVIEYLHGLVIKEESLAQFLEPIPELIPWGMSGMYFSGRWAEPSTDALLKVNVSESQRFWSTAIPERAPDLAPRVLASGARLDGIELGWVLMERLPTGLHDGWGGAEFSLLMDAGARFQKIARTMDPVPPCTEVTADGVQGWLALGRERNAPGPVDAVIGRFWEDWGFLNRVCEREICHGDLHMANVLMRTLAPEISPALLIDFEPCRMPWVFDAAYAQVLNSDPRRVGWRHMVGQMAGRRRAHGLPVCADDVLRRAGTIALGWYAMRMWGMFGPTPDPAWRESHVWHEQNRSYIEDIARLGPTNV